MTRTAVACADDRPERHQALQRAAGAFRALFRLRPPAPEPPQLAVAAKAFIDGIDHPVTLRFLRTTARLGGWVGSRAAGSYDAKLCDAIADAALDSVIELLRQWASEAENPSAESPAE